MAAGPVTMPERNAMRTMRPVMSEREIARRTRRSIQTVQRHAGDIPSTCRPGRKGLSPETRAAILADIEANWSRPMVARRYGVGIVTLPDILDQARRERREREAHA